MPAVGAMAGLLAWEKELRRFPRQFEVSRSQLSQVAVPLSD
jgi:hypothetical protein